MSHWQEDSCINVEEAPGVKTKENTGHESS